MTQPSSREDTPVCLEVSPVYISGHKTYIRTEHFFLKARPILA